MLLAVAGLSEQEIQERSARLAGRDWSGFTPAEQSAFHFAGRHAREPWAISAGDTGQLVRFHGEARALDVIWWSSRCHFMTRVADALQLPLETENVFQDPPLPAEPLPDRPVMESGTGAGLPQRPAAGKPH
jgi:hypothetical protein